PYTHTPASWASWTTASAALVTAGRSSSGNFIQPSSNEIRYRGIPRLLVSRRLLRPPLTCSTNSALQIRHAADRSRLPTKSGHSRPPSSGARSLHDRHELEDRGRELVGVLADAP